MTIFFDLDGTLLDSKDRLYKLFQHLVPLSQLTYDEYWSLKQNKIGHEEILTTKFNYSPKEISEFKTLWLNNIELREWLDLDLPFAGIIEFLQLLKKNGNILYVVTARQHKQAAINQLERVGLKHFFENILVTEQKTEKVDLIKSTVKTTSNDWMIGDTGKDILTGKLLGLKTVAVLSGFLNEEKLKEYQPDFIIDNVVNLNLIKGNYAR